MIEKDSQEWIFLFLVTIQLKKEFIMVKSHFLSRFSFVKISHLVCILCLNLFAFSATAAEPLDINQATAKQLSLIMTGVGESKAQAIIDYRQQNGPFESVEDLIKVRGIGSAILDKNRLFITVAPVSDSSASVKLAGSESS